MRRRSFAMSSILFLAAFAWPMTAGAQEPVSDFFETVEVNVVTLEVFVTDKRGKPVTGLTVDDFEVFDNGDPVDISYFLAVEGQNTVPASPGDATDASTVSDVSTVSAPNIAEASAPRQSVVPSREANAEALTVVLFVDAANIQEHNRDRVLDKLRESPWFQDGNRDRVMVVAHRGSGAVDVVQHLTDDPKALAGALESLTTIPTGGSRVLGEFISLSRNMLDLTREEGSINGGFSQGNDAEPALIEASIQEYSERRFGELRNTVRALESFVDSLAGLQGRKALVYVSDGLPLRPGEALAELFDGFTNDSGSVAINRGEFDASSLFQGLANAANGHRVTFYPMLAGGKTVYSQPLVAIQRAVPSDQTGRMRAWDDRVEAVLQSNLRGPVEMIAEATGGRAFTEPKRFDDAVQEMHRDQTHYYSLGYSLPFSGEGQTHELEVRLKDPSLKVRHRRGYHEKTQAEQMSEQTLTALIFEEGENPLGVLVELGEIQDHDRGLKRVPITVKIPISRLLLLPQESHHTAQIAIFVGTRDADGRTSPIQQVPAPLRIPNDRLLTALGQVMSFQVGLVMRPQEHDVAVGVRDELADVDSIAKVTFRPEAVADTGLSD